MIASRGMGAVRPELKKPKKILRKDALEPTKLYAEGGESRVSEADKIKSGGLPPPEKKSKLERVAQAAKEGAVEGFRTATKMGSPVGRAMNINYELYKKATNTSPLEDIIADLERRQKTEIKTDGKTFSKGGESRVNEAGNYTKPGMRKSLFNKIKSQATQGTAAGQWSARKAQLLAKQYKAKGGGYKD